MSQANQSYIGIFVKVAQYKEVEKETGELESGIRLLRECAHLVTLDRHNHANILYQYKFAFLKADCRHC